ncbi:MAG: O-antigen ligase family protein [Gammaproteobacteria bacterium]|nr:O-antigen ligase family protein [Gammaproteobacteria bacterium]
MKRNRPAPGTPILNSLLLIGLVLGGPVALFILFTYWEDSLQRQLVGIAGLLTLGAFLLLRRKYEILMLALLFSSQFAISLLSIRMADPAVFQIWLTDVFLLLFFIGAIERGEKFRADGIGWLLVILIAWLAITSIFSAHQSRSIVFLTWQLKYLGVYLLLRNADISEKLAKRFVLVALGAIAIQAAIAFAQSIVGNLGLVVLGEQDPDRLRFVKGALRVSGTLGATNGFAGYLSMLLVFALPFLFRRRNPVWYVIHGFGVIALLVTYSRAGWLSFVVGSAVVAFGLLRVGIIRPSRIISLGLLGAAIVGIGVAVYFDRVQDRFQDQDAIQSAEGRLLQFSMFWPIIEDYPIFGIGPGVTEYFGAWNDNEKYVRQELPDVRMTNQPHSSQLQYWIETGTPGFLLFIALFVAVFRSALARPRSRRDRPELSFLRIGAAAAAAAAMTHASFGTEINSHQISLIFWMFLAMARNDRLEVAEFASRRAARRAQLAGTQTSGKAANASSV